MPCLGYHVQGRPDEAALDKILQLQRAVLATSPVALRLIPPEALHLSVITLISAEFPSDSICARWAEIEQAIGDVSVSSGREENGFSVTLDRLEFTNRALIIFTPKQPKWLLDLRRQFSEILRSIGHDAPSYDRSHITIARYAESAQIPVSALQTMEKLDSPVRTRFDNIRLVRERRYPSLAIHSLYG